MSIGRFATLSQTPGVIFAISGVTLSTGYLQIFNSRTLERNKLIAIKSIEATGQFLMNLNGINTSDGVSVTIDDPKNKNYIPNPNNSFDGEIKQR